MLEIVELLEKTLGISAELDWQPAQTGDVRRTWADITAAREAVGYAPSTMIEAGIERFVEWLRSTKCVGARG